MYSKLARNWKMLLLKMCLLALVDTIVIGPIINSTWYHKAHVIPEPKIYLKP